ncbi:hypothetical protein BDZ94DRAFT_1239167 [Collybia nuda]|uniref:Uncharacterized protein n=1 Tax=Collybia nuda TaxID=64659 RepID=A0A9P5XZK4_9AGAR|nr:hypothetical protein BDZ94DRAFT_1239167 [Collybia nuda]
MAGITIFPTSSKYFSQSQCNTEKSYQTWYSLLWFMKEMSITSEINVIEWTRNMLEGTIIPMTPHRIAAILFIIQVSVVTSIPGRVLPYLPATTVSGLILIATFLLSGRPSSFFSSETFILCVFFFLILVTSVSNQFGYLPGSPFGVICILLWVQRSSSKYSALRRPWAFLTHLFITICVTSVQFLVNVGTLNTIDKSKAFLGTPLFIHFISWIYPWVIMRESKVKSWVGFTRLLWSNVLQPAPFLKFNHLFIVPHVAWIWATIVANPTPTNDLTFGQGDHTLGVDG